LTSRWFVVDVIGNGSDGLSRHISNIVLAPTAKAAVLSTMDIELFQNETRRCGYGYYQPAAADSRRLIVFVLQDDWFQTECQTFEQMVVEVGSPEEGEMFKHFGRPLIDKLLGPPPAPGWE
jgi:hypothetical protein